MNLRVSPFFNLLKSTRNMMDIEVRIFGSRLMYLHQKITFTSQQRMVQVRPEDRYLTMNIIGAEDVNLNTPYVKIMILRKELLIGKFVCLTERFDCTCLHFVGLSRNPNHLSSRRSTLGRVDACDARDRHFESSHQLL